MPVSNLGDDFGWLFCVEHIDHPCAVIVETPGIFFWSEEGKGEGCTCRSVRTVGRADGGGAASVPLSTAFCPLMPPLDLAPAPAALQASSGS